MAKGLSTSLRRNLIGYAFIAPWLIGFVFFTLGPFIASIGLSFTRYNIVQRPVYVGVANYRTLLFDDALFWKSLGTTLKYALIAVPTGIVAGVGLSLLLNINVRGSTLYRTLFYVPSIVPAVATNIVFLWLLNPQLGLINLLLGSVGIKGPNWLQETSTALPSLVFVSLWGVGGSMVTYLAGLKDIPTHLYEAAKIDGASPAQMARRITLPMLTPVIFFNLVMGCIGAFQQFTNAFIMTGGGPEDSTLFYALYLFNRAWKFLDMGYASAMAWVLFTVIVSITAIVFRSQKRWVHYGGG